MKKGNKKGTCLSDTVMHAMISIEYTVYYHCSQAKKWKRKMVKAKLLKVLNLLWKIVIQLKRTPFPGNFSKTT